MISLFIFDAISIKFLSKFIIFEKVAFQSESQFYKSIKQVVYEKSCIGKDR